ncbi:CapA family protein [bacterium]|nr:CapA family protein [bacterium]
MKRLLCVLVFFSILLVWHRHQGPDPVNDSMSLLFIGDIMGHDSQIAAAWDIQSKSYSYDAVFACVEHVIKGVDFAIANLEVTLAGPPYRGYPCFSSPDALAGACKRNGIDVVLTANNHVCDRGKKGMLRTMHVLDSLEIGRTGAFADSTDKIKNGLLVLEKNNIRVGILNYTYGTNGVKNVYPTIVNRIDTLQIARDILNSKNRDLDKLIVAIHWGNEYKYHPAEKQEFLAEFLFQKGVDVIIGGHPHVLQRMEYHAPTDSTKERFIAYSLGNFVSNMYRKNCDGGAMVELHFQKSENGIALKKYGYDLVWVHQQKKNHRRKFEVLVISECEEGGYAGLDDHAIGGLNVFKQNARCLLTAENKGVLELKRGVFATK